MSEETLDQARAAVHVKAQQAPEDGANFGAEATHRGQLAARLACRREGAALVVEEAWAKSAGEGEIDDALWSGLSRALLVACARSGLVEIEARGLARAVERADDLRALRGAGAPSQGRAGG